MSSRNFKSPPVMREDMTYEDWKSDVEIWSDFTDLEPEKKRQCGVSDFSGEIPTDRARWSDQS